MGPDLIIESWSPFSSGLLSKHELQNCFARQRQKLMKLFPPLNNTSD